MGWRTTYPTLAQVQVADFYTLDTWVEKLPPAQTDVERTVMRRLLAARDKQSGVLVREKNPALADKMRDLGKRLDGIGIANPFRDY